MLWLRAGRPEPLLLQGLEKLHRHPSFYRICASGLGTAASSRNEHICVLVMPGISQVLFEDCSSAQDATR